MNKYVYIIYKFRDFSTFELYTDIVRIMAVHKLSKLFICV